jgi:triacylglycerol esterase/lipase EstA (alpha/beta hydrolase family)
MTMRKILILGVLAAALAVPNTAAAATPPPPGANDWSCTPTAAHPHPVVLVHGTAENMLNNWLSLSPALKAEGYCVFALNYGGSGGEAAGVYATGPVADSARELAAFVDRVRAETGAQEVSLVGHSQGGMMPRQYIKFEGGIDKVDELVALSPSNHGTTHPLTAPLGLACPACNDQLAGSPFLQNLNAGDETPGDISYTQVVTKTDEVVIPYTSGYLAEGPNTTNIRIQDRCPLDLTEHLAISHDRVAIQWVKHALGRTGPADPAFRPHCL